jgi:transposase InsO family protein
MWLNTIDKFKGIDVHAQQDMQHFNIKHLATSAYHPHTNGKCKRLNGILGHIISKYVGTHRVR